MTHLDQARLSDCCDRLRPAAKCFFFDTLGSTNAWLSDQRPDSADFLVCTCDHQTGGKGRSGKQWHVSAGEDIAVSFRWRYPLSRETEIATLSLLAGLVTAKCCQTFSNDLIQIKWPNDLVCRDKKLAGILLERLPDHEVVIGIGVNLASITSSRSKDIAQPAIGLAELSEARVDRQIFLEQLITAMHEALQLFAKEGFAFFHSQWQALDYLKDFPLRHELGDSVRMGVGRGISEKGELILEDALGQQRLIHAGTVRRVEK